MATIAAALGALGVAAGAFGAHMLRDAVPVARLATWDTAADYHLWHALALFAAAMVLRRAPGSRAAKVACGALLAGTLIFSGSLYTLVLTDTPALGAVTPIGGLSLLVGWIALAVAAWTTGVSRGRRGGGSP